MTRAVFLRMLEFPSHEKGSALRRAIGAANRGDGGATLYLAEPSSLRLVPGSPFAYWISGQVRGLFEVAPPLSSEGRHACVGLSTKDDFRFLRLSWEVAPSTKRRKWFPFAKGGAYSPYHHDLHLCLNWEDDGQELKAFANMRTEELFGRASWSRWINNWDFYFRPGLTWPRRTNGLSVRCLPSGCIFGDKGPAAFVAGDDETSLLALLAIMNSAAFRALVELQLARTELAQSFEVGLIQQTPVPSDLWRAEKELASIARQAHDIVRSANESDETTHVFGLPALLKCVEKSPSLLELTQALTWEENERKDRLRALQAKIDTLVGDLYGVPELDMPAKESRTELIGDASGEEPDEEDEALPFGDASLIADLIQWCLGVAFGRWDLRFALDQSLPPSLQGPFDPLAVCAPGTLVGPDGLPARSGSIVSETWLRARRNALALPEQFDGQATIPDSDYPLSIAWDGILVDDHENPRDLVASVRRVLVLIWGDRAEAIEREACQILGFDSLWSYLRDPRRGFFAFHIRHYSKSRRNAPIYWLLQSLKRNYGLWLYYHYLHGDSLFHAAREYVDPKVAVEESRLKELQGELGAVTGAERRVRERGAAEQMAFVEELRAFKNTIDEVAMLELKPDLNDGVLLNIAPLHRLVPWKEAERAWDDLIQGKYEWSSIGKQLRQRGLVKGM